MTVPESDRASELGECCRHAPDGWDVDGDLVVAAAILYESVPAMIVCAVWSVGRPRIGLSRCLSWRCSASIGLLAWRST